MKKFEIDVDINGTITFEVEAKNKKEAQAKVDYFKQHFCKRSNKIIQK